MVFAPIERSGAFEAIGYYDLLARPSLAERPSLVGEALSSGALRAYVQPEGDSRFYKVPSDHWTIDAFLEGEPGETLYCWATSAVPAKFQDRPLLFLLDEVEQWERTLSMDDALACDYVAFDDCLARSGRPSLGYWPPITTLAWIVSRDDRFVATVQLYEQEQHANRGGPHSAAVWLVVGNKLGMIYGRTLTDAEAELREALEAETLPGAIATNRRTGETAPIPRHMWTRWSVAHQHLALELIPGFADFQFPSASVRATFPSHKPEQTSQQPDASRGVLPSWAKPNDYRHEQPAHEAAEIVRNNKVRPGTAFRQVAPSDPMRSEDAVCRAIRSAYDLMYLQDGRPRQN